MRLELFERNDAGKTEHISAEIEVKQLELQPWANKVSAKNNEIDVATSERDLLEEKSAKAQRELQEAKETLEKLKDAKANNQNKVEELIKERKQVEQSITESTRANAVSN